jgi:hypothetical protein
LQAGESGKSKRKREMAEPKKMGEENAHSVRSSEARIIACKTRTRKATHDTIAS